MDVLRMAWRNLWRNWKRTAICVSAASVGTAILMLVFGLFLGLSEQLARSAVSLGLGEAQVHAPGYLSEPSLWTTIDRPEVIAAAAMAAGARVAARRLGGALLGLGDKSTGALLHGIDPEAERRIGKLPDRIASGTWLEAEAGGGVVLGAKLARALDVQVGSELLVLAQAADGTTASDTLRVIGILKSIGSGPDRTHAYLHARDFEALYGLGGGIHELALVAAGPADARGLVGRLALQFPGADVRGWQRLQPAVADMVAMFDASIWLPAALFLLVAGLGILNTILMATFERIPEFGMVRALGASPWHIVRDVAAEGLVLGGISAVLGGTVGAVLCAVGAVHGFDVSSGGALELGGIVVDPVVHVRVTPLVVAFPIAAMWTVSLLAALYPAVKAARLQPAQALVHT